jgi:hypothetical protein
VPGVPGFDYKLRIGAVQYLGPSGCWRRRARPPLRVPLVDRYERRLLAVERALLLEGVACERRIYPGFVLGQLVEPYLHGLVHVRCLPGDGDELVLIEYSPKKDIYVVCRARVDNELDFLDEYDPVESLADGYEMRALTYGTCALRFRSEREAAGAARQAVESLLGAG